MSSSLLVLTSKSCPKVCYGTLSSTSLQWHGIRSTRSLASGFGFKVRVAGFRVGVLGIGF